MFQKLIILAAIVAAVWYGFKFVSRLDQQRKRNLAEKERDALDGIADTVQCPVCDIYVAADSASDCGKPDCPYRSG